MTWLPVLAAFIIPSLGLAAGWGSIREWQRLHEQADAERFKDIKEMLTEMRQDLKSLLRSERDQ